ncbi:glycosyltransferase family 2 protein [Romeria aff. gracilis LEGE 07310]|uniref:Glycosyltransferase family 2 protein n=1 Tax=Vasconcelosia minhoensis LEGE 07310 TaxID=915328 RepID=A0A8J7AMD8_9CYAN|nr:glycosyltransferase family 2 protein [Romeria gracilis]MBE9076936.1 glycosyltransferase family 2 protein [Romeria aff. gracilis LEGE 07310]
MSFLSSSAQSTFRPIKVVEIELSQPLPSFEGLVRYEFLQILVRLHSSPLGYLTLPLPNGKCSASTIKVAILKELNWKLIQNLTINALATGDLRKGLPIQDVVQGIYPAQPLEDYPLVTVCVCTRNRTENLQICLDTLVQLDYPNLELLVVDNAPSDDSTEKLVSSYSNVRYIQELRPGLSWARNRALKEARGEFLAYTDDDVLVDKNWVTALVKTFQQYSEAVAVTGLVAPYELEYKSQILFERHGGFGKGFEPKVFSKGKNQVVPWYLLGTGQCGTGANMAFNRHALSSMGGFNSALGAGTPTRGCEDLEIFFQVLKSGHSLVYEPAALVWHRHRQDYESLRVQLASDGVGLYSYFLHGFINYAEERWSFLLLALWWLWYGNLRHLWTSFRYPKRFPKDLIWAEFLGCFQGITAYLKSQRQTRRLAMFSDSQTYGLKPVELKKTEFLSNVTTGITTGVTKLDAVAVRTLELSQPIQSFTDVAEYDQVRIFLNWHNSPLGSVNLTHSGCPISTDQLRQAIFDGLKLKTLELNKRLSNDLQWSQVMAALSQNWPLATENIEGEIPLPQDKAVSVILATYDRPEELRRALNCLVNQISPRTTEVIVVDNHPASGLTSPVLEEFTSVHLVNEPRKGLAYARNAGIVASQGDIIVMTDDDVSMPPTWIEQLVSPFARPDVMAVTGNILPLQLETKSQRLFESYGGLGRGFEGFEVDGNWFELFPYKAVPTWTLGATANAAFRASIFHHPQIGLMDEALGPGMPSGVGEDTYLFYKVLKAGYTIVYKPQAYVWHQHRQTMGALYKQLFNYSKGHVAYHLNTWFKDGDWRGLVQVAVGLPIAHASRIYHRLRGRSTYPVHLILLEILGNINGPWGLLHSRLRVLLKGKSAPYRLPLFQRVELSASSTAGKEIKQQIKDLSLSTNIEP